MVGLERRLGPGRRPRATAVALRRARRREQRWWVVAYLVSFPMAGGDPVIVEMDDEQMVGFTPAPLDPGEVAATVAESFETAIDRVLPPLRAISERMKQLAPAELTVAVGVKLTAEAGVIL